MATEAGLKGLVCSPKEIAPLREVLPAEVKLVTLYPPCGSETGDQKRVMSPADAVKQAQIGW